MTIIECTHETPYCILCDRIKNDHYRQVIFEIQKKDCSIFLCNKCLEDLTKILVQVNTYEVLLNNMVRNTNDFNKKFFEIDGDESDI